ncbi:hypothetical protein H0486_05000 [Lachnospiraceae bacterium MD1]|uniref:CRESS-DNA virus Rep endonuclease domain-containing protein n=1 Tax=Variimorphobacter saccharofermentans TaxID=2755051 RepID=A0A839JZ26_9FIRM|nr:hypothetical protein [Variimorphobacter saccharofermentans]MBB2182232.1 hypothetical protein [Variimorphobacter saccharofermentans]
MRQIQKTFVAIHSKEVISISNKQSRKYQLTINNPTPEFSHDRIKEICLTKFRSFKFLAMVDEIGEKGTPHTHIFLCFDSAVRFSTVKKNFNSAHIEMVKGSIQQNIDYLTKAGKWANTQKAETTVSNSYEELGDRPPENKGRNRDLEELYHMIVDEELSNAEIIRLNQDYIMQIDKLDKIRTTYLQDKFKGLRRLDLEVTYVFGVTGSGKSRDILDTYGDENVYRVTNYVHGFDQYSCEPIIVFEEFRSSLSIKDMLNYLDVYPVVLQARYNNKYACYHKVFICTNWKLEKQYSEIQETDKESWNAFLRRIHKVMEYTERGVITYNSVDKYMKRNSSFTSISQLTKEDQLNIPFLRVE